MMKPGEHMGIHVAVKLSAGFREAAGKREILVEVGSNAVLKDVLDVLAEKYGGDFEKIVDWKRGSVSLEFLVSLNGRIVRSLDVNLKNNDILMLTIPVGGG